MNFRISYTPEMDVEDADGDANGEGDENHGEEEVFSKQGNGQGRRGDNFRQQQEEDRQ